MNMMLSDMMKVTYLQEKGFTSLKSMWEMSALNHTLRFLTFSVGWRFPRILTGKLDDSV